jgi:predicted ester cyclase
MMVPTKHRIYPRQQDNTPLLDLLLVSIDLSDMRFEATKLEANKELVRAYTRTVFNEHQTDRASEFLAPEVKWHGGILGTMDGLANVAALLRGFVGALPDLTATEQDLVAEGDTVAVRYVVEATHKGDLMGIPATGRRVRWGAFDVYRVADGKIVEEWAGDDLLAFIHTLGVYTPPWLA